MLDVIRQDYIRTAKAKGASDRAVIYKHARQCFIPIITVIGLQLANVLTGSVLRNQYLLARHSTINFRSHFQTGHSNGYRPIILCVS